MYNSERNFLEGSAVGIRAVLLDAGHTLLEGRPSWFDIWEEALATFDLALDREALQRAYARASDLLTPLLPDSVTPEVERRFLREMVAYLQVPGREEELAEYMHRILAKVRPEYAPYPEVPEVLEELRRRGYRLAVVSNWEPDLPDVLRRVGLLDAFEVVVASAVVGAAKPDPRIFRVALDALRLEPHTAVHVGDSYEADVQGARAAGIQPVLLDRDYIYQQSDVPLIRTLKELLPLLEKPSSGDGDGD